MKVPMLQFRTICRGVVTFIRHASSRVRVPLVLVAIAPLTILVMALAWLYSMPDLSVLKDYRPLESIQIFDRYDRLVTTVDGDEDRVYVPIERISKPMQQAVIAAEDRHFYEHGGINILSIVRAAWTNFQAGKL